VSTGPRLCFFGRTVNPVRSRCLLIGNVDDAGGSGLACSVLSRCAVVSILVLPFGSSAETGFAFANRGSMLPFA